MRAWSSLLVSTAAVFLAGCTESPSIDEAVPISDNGPTGTAGASAPAPASPLPVRENQSYPSQEFDFHVTLAISGTTADAQADAAEMMRQVDIPAGANTVALEATWTPNIPPAARQFCMAHVGTLEEMGPMIGGRAGASPLQVGPIGIPARNETLVVMCMVVGDPAGAEVVQTIHLKLDFAYVRPT